MTDSQKRGPAERLRNAKVFPVLYMFGIMVFFASILIGFCRLTDDRVEANKRVSFEAAILTALEISIDAGASAADIHNVFEKRITLPTPASAGAYIVQEKGQIIAYALPVEGQGFWATIRGVVGIKKDGMTLKGIAFYEQNETPGLGAEIVKPYFTKRFRGLTMSETEEPIGIKPMGLPLAPHDVEGITGATQTCGKLEAMMNEALQAWRKQVKKEGGV